MYHFAVKTALYNLTNYHGNH